MHKATAIHAVITGDLVASTSLPDDRLDRAMAALQTAAGAWGDLHFTRFRGDGWQVLIHPPGRALRIALSLTAALAAADTGLATRLAIGFGPVARVGPGDLSAATGPAFHRSGRALDALPRGQHWAIAPAPGLPDWIAAAVPLAEWHAARWTRGQAAVVTEFLHPDDLTQGEWATRMGLSRQAWAARLAGSGITAWLPTLHLWEGWNGAGLTDD